MLDSLPRRSAAIAAGVLLLTGALSSCGFDYATNRVNTISSGVNDQEGEVDVLGAAIISGSPDTGLFVATLSNANPSVPISLTAVGGEVMAPGLAPVEVSPQGTLSLYQSGGIPLDGTIGLGEFVSVELTFDSGQTSTLEVAVMRPCYEYDPAKFPDMVLPTAPAADGETPAASPAASPSPSPEAEGTTEATDPYACAPIVAEPPAQTEE